MKVIKPLRLGVLTKPFEKDLKFHLSISLVAFFPFDNPDRLLPDVALWKLAGEVLGAEAILDELMPKPKAELLVAGSAFPPNPPQPHCRVRVAMADVDRSLYVFGDRFWRTTSPTDPVPFSEMPLSWSKAFGGEGFALNPAGKGIKAGAVHALPNVEDPKQLVLSPGDAPAPACMLSLDLASVARIAKAGTYDQSWLEQRYPGFPVDFDWSFFQVAQAEQRFGAFLRGGETFTVENMHREQPLLSSRLPRGRGRCLVVRKVDGQEQAFDVPTHIDTVWLFPNQMRGAVIHRAVIDVSEDDASDVLQLVGAYELPEAPRPFAHYQRALAERLDKKAALSAVLRDSDLLPELPPKGDQPDDEIGDMAQLLKTDGAMTANARRGAERQVDQANARFEQLAALKGQSKAALPPPAPPVGVEDLSELYDKAMEQAAEARQKADTETKAAEERARALCAQHGLDYEKMRADAKRSELERKRTFSARDQVERLASMATLFQNAGADASALRIQLHDRKFLEKLAKAERGANDAYRMSAHLMEPTLAEPDAYSRDELVTGAKAKQSFAGRDLTRADLSGLDLTGIDLEGAFLERANLRGAILDGANLRRALFAHADLSGARLSRTDLTDANLGGATLDDTLLPGSVLDGAILWETVLRRTVMQGAHLARTQLGLATLEDVDLSTADGSELTLIRTKLTRVKLVGAKLTKSVFVEGELVDVDFSRASCKGLVFVSSNGERVCFDHAELASVRFVKDCSFKGATFRGSQMPGANLRGAILTGCDFSGALLDRADFSEADLCGANLERAHANDALFIRTKLEQASLRQTDLVMAIMQKARVDGADFQGANLFRGDAMGMRGDAATSFRDAFVKRVRFTPVGRRGQD